MCCGIKEDNIVAGHLLYKMFHQNQILIENTYLFQNYLILYEFDIDKDLSYDVSESRETVERRNNDEYNLHTQRGLRDTRPSDIREQDSSGGQIRNDEVKVLEREQEISIYNSINEQSTSRTLDEYSRSSNGESRTDSIRNESQREDNRTNETTRPYEMDRLNEQLEDISRGDSSERIDLRLNNYDPSQSKTHYVVVDEKIKDDVMKHIYDEAGLDTQGQGIIISLPILDAVGFEPLEEYDEEKM